MIKSMFTLLVFTCIIICASTALGQDSGDEPQDSARIEWVDSFEAAQVKAIAENKMILLDFYSDT